MTATLAADYPAFAPQADPRRTAIDPELIRRDAEGRRHIEFLVPDMHCANCLAKIERTAAAVSGVTHARANLTNKRVAVTLDERGAPETVLEALLAIGRDARPFDPGATAAVDAKRTDSELMRALVVAGFASTNVMLLSVSVWSGAEGATRDLFHWISAMIAIPAVIYAGRPFFRSAWKAVSRGQTNMDVPISIGVIVATALSLYETATGGRHAWFDGSVGLLFFLLVGRYLDDRMRDIARASAARLLSLAPTIADLVLPNGTVTRTAIRSVRKGDVVRVAPGERVPLDGTVLSGGSDLDRSVITGESLPESVGIGSEVHAGAMNLTGCLDVRVTAQASDTLLAGIVRLMEGVERPDGRFLRIADRAARLYAPVVHTAALLTMLGWLAFGYGFHPAITAAVAVLIITCPCALGLAVPAVQIVAAGRLLSAGIILKDGAGLEKLSTIDTVVFDKTGTLTCGRPRLLEAPALADAEWPVVAALAGASRHPLSRALAAEAVARETGAADLAGIIERPGLGVEAVLADGRTARLGRPAWVDAENACDAARTEVWMRIGEAPARRFAFVDELRADAATTVAALRGLGLEIVLLSGDTAAAVDAAAEAAGIAHRHAACLPGEKVEILRVLTGEGRRVMMVGDGINDAPALAAANVSMSPASGSGITQAAADLVFTGERLQPVVTALLAARQARRKIFQNFALAIGYNVIAVPIAILGYATPLIAAVAMSTSSIVVVANALTVSWKRDVSARVRERAA